MAVESLIAAARSSHALAAAAISQVVSPSHSIARDAVD
jgi:hypothetical protein